MWHKHIALFLRFYLQGLCLISLWICSHLTMEELRLIWETENLPCYKICQCLPAFNKKLKLNRYDSKYLYNWHYVCKMSFHNWIKLLCSSVWNCVDMFLIHILYILEILKDSRDNSLHTALSWSFGSKCHCISVFHQFLLVYWLQKLKKNFFLVVLYLQNTILSTFSCGWLFNISMNS